MNINPVQGFKEKSTAQKAAIVAGGVAAVGAAASLVYAAKTGKADTFVDSVKKAGGKTEGIGFQVKKAFAKVGDGYKKLGTAIAEKAGNAKKAVVKFFKKDNAVAEEVKETAEKKGADVAETVEKAAGEVAENA